MSATDERISWGEQAQHSLTSVLKIVEHLLGDDDGGYAASFTHRQAVVVAARRHKQTSTEQRRMLIPNGKTTNGRGGDRDTGGWEGETANE